MQQQQPQQPQQPQGQLPKSIDAIFVQLREDLVKETILTSLELRVAGVESHPGLKRIKEWCMKGGKHPKMIAAYNVALQQAVALFDLGKTTDSNQHHVIINNNIVADASSVFDQKTWKCTICLT